LAELPLFEEDRRRDLRLRLFGWLGDRGEGACEDRQSERQGDEVACDGFEGVLVCHVYRP
jgi:hypothetical protein